MKSQMKFFNIFLGLGIVSFSGCNQNPTPEGVVLTATPAAKVQRVAAVALNLQNSYNCTENLLCEFTIQAVVPAPGKPVVTVTNLPAGATFDPVGLKFSWKPGFDVVDPSNGGGLVRIIPLEFQLKSDINSTYNTIQTVDLKVQNTPQNWSFQTDPKLTVDEGSELVQDVHISNPDYPKGPFNVTVEGAPAGVQVVSDSLDPAHFQIKFTPDYSFVKSTDLEDGESAHVSGKGISSYYRSLDLNVVVRESNSGNVRRLPTNWIVRDVRQLPVLSGPLALQVRDEAFFNVRADDLNYEAAPAITLASPVPFGDVQISPALQRTVTQRRLARVSSPNFSPAPSSLVVVDWKNIPLSAAGKTYPLKLQSCIDNGLEGQLCQSMEVAVTFTFKGAPAPVITRDAWPFTQTLYAKAGGKTQISLPIVDGEDSTRAVDVAIYPESIRNEFSWSGGVLTVSPQTEGLKQIKVVATSTRGQAQSESFVIDVLPADWSSVVVLSDDAQKPEIQAILKAFPSASVVHPVFQKEARTFALRNIVLVTTEMLQALSTSVDWKAFDQRIKGVPNLWVSSALVDSLQTHSAYFSGLMTASGVSFPGKFSKYAGGEKLSSFEIYPNALSNLDKPSALIKLAGTLTSYSSDPSLIHLFGASICTSLLDLKGMVANYTLAVSCPKENGSVVLFGTEFSDLQFGPNDGQLFSSWTSKLLKYVGARR